MKFYSMTWNWLLSIDFLPPSHSTLAPLLDSSFEIESAGKIWPPVPPAIIRIFLDIVALFRIIRSIFHVDTQNNC